MSSTRTASQRTDTTAGSRIRLGLARLVRVFSSFQLACILLVLLLALTWFGTMAQAERSLFDVQRDYFESVIVVEKIGPVPFLLPGAYLLLSLLLLNLLLGGIVRMRRGTRTIGVLITHVGIIVLLLGSFIEHQFSDKGYIRLFEGQEAHVFRSHNEWELVVTERLTGSRIREHLIPDGELEDLAGGRTRDFHFQDLPFAVRASGYVPDAEPIPASRSGTGAADILLREVEAGSSGSELRVPGLGIQIRDATGTEHRAVLWGLQTHPWVFEEGARVFEFDLRRRTWPLGEGEQRFSIRLDRFERELHPRSGLARRFSSWVTKLEGTTARQVHITMNEPLRHQGYTFYQSSWGPERGGGPLWSQFAVVRNPSDRVPLIACVIIAVGLVIHFGRKLILHLARASGRQPTGGTR